MKTFLLALISLIIFLAGCAGTQDSRRSSEYTKPVRKSTDLSSAVKVKSRLYSQYKEWKAVRYKLGGLSKRGIDCSGFVYITYRNRFGIKLPRTTALQSRIGSRVSKSRLRAGDLVFFRTSSKVRHVGIYLEDGNFMHASTSKGVSISSLQNIYWSKKYWKSVRIDL
ncbi:MAG: NlpC/P60 family protein [Nitrospirota bacterium]